MNGKIEIGRKCSRSWKLTHRPTGLHISLSPLWTNYARYLRMFLWQVLIISKYCIIHFIALVKKITYTNLKNRFLNLTMDKPTWSSQRGSGLWGKAIRGACTNQMHSTVSSPVLCWILLTLYIIWINAFENWSTVVLTGCVGAKRCLAILRSLLWTTNAPSGAWGLAETTTSRTVRQTTATFICCKK